MTWAVEHLPRVLEALSSEPIAIVKERQAFLHQAHHTSSLLWLLSRQLANSGSLALSVCQRQICCLAYQLR